MFLTLVKLRLRELLLGVSKKKKRGLGLMVLLYIVSFVALGAIAAMLFFSLALVMGESSAPWVYFSFAGFLIFLLTFIGSIYATQNQIFEAKDNEFLFAMPIKARDIIASRILALLLVNYGYTLVIYLPAAIVWGRFVGFTAAGFLFSLFSALLLPLFALAISMVCGWIAASLSSRMKRKNIVTTILYAIFFMVYIAVCSMWSQILDKMAENIEVVAAGIRRTVPPLYWMGSAAAEGNALHMLLFALFCLIPFLIVLFVLSRTFFAIATRKRGGVRNEYKEGSLKVSSVQKALNAREMTRFTSSTSYMMNGGMGLIFMVVVAVGVIIKRDMMTEISGAFDRNVNGLIGVLAMLFCLAMVIISAPSVSLEAKTLWILRSLPVDDKAILRAKLDTHVRASVPFILLTATVWQFIGPMDPLSRILVYLIPFLGTVLFAEIGLLLNLKVPKFDWINEAAAVKQSLAPFLAMMVAFAITALILVGTLFLEAVLFKTELPMMLVLFAFLLLLGFAFYRLLMGWGVRRWRSLEN